MSENKLSEVINEELEGLVEETNYTDTLLPPIEIDLDTYNQEDFMKGIDDASYLAGFITGILNAGVSEEFVLTYLINKETIEYNIKSIELNNKANVEISKNQKIMLERQEL